MRSNHLSTVMPALVAGVHVFLAGLQTPRVRYWQNVLESAREADADWSEQPWHQLLLFPRQHEIQLFGDPVAGYSLLTPFVDTTGVLPKKPHMAEGNEKMYRLKIRM